MINLRFDDLVSIFIIHGVEVPFMLDTDATDFSIGASQDHQFLDENCMSHHLPINYFQKPQ